MMWGDRSDTRSQPPRGASVPRKAAELVRVRPWLVVGLVAVIARLIPLLLAIGDIRHFLVFPDSFEYEQLAVNLISGHGFSEAFAPPYTPDVRRTPLYPLLLAGIYLGAGHYPIVAVGVNGLLGSATCLLTYELGRRLYSQVVGIMAGLLLAIDVTSTVYSLTLLTETLFTVIVVLCVIVIDRCLSVPTPRMLFTCSVLAAGLCGIAFLARPIALFLPFVLGPALALLRRNLRPGVRLLLSATFVLVALAFPLSWTIRNYLVAGVAQPTSIIAINAYYDQATLVVKQRQGTAGVEDETPAAFLPDKATGPAQEVTGSDVLSLERRAWAILSGDPVGYLKLYVRGIQESLHPDRDIVAQLGAEPADFRTTTARVGDVIAPTALIRHPAPNSALLAASTFQLLVVYALAAVGAASGISDHPLRPTTLLLLLVIVYFLLISGPVAYPRFRVPVMPFIVLLAAEGAYRITSIVSRFSKAPSPTTISIQ